MSPSAKSLPPGWAFKRLDDFAETSSGGTPSRGRAEFYGGAIPWVKSGELPDGLVRTTEETITELGLKSSSAKLFPRGTLCIALYGATVGKLGILDMEAATNQAVCAIFLPPDIDAKYVYWFLRLSRPALIEQGKGGAQPNISQQIVRSIQVPLAPREARTAILSEIEKQSSRIDAGTSALVRVQANLKRYRASVLKAACEGRLVPTEAELARRESRDYEPASVLLQRILKDRRRLWEESELAKLKAKGKPPTDDRWKGKYQEPETATLDQLPSLPAGWCWATVGQLVGEIQAGASFRCDERPPAGDEVGVVKVSAVTWGEYDELESKTCQDPDRIDPNLFVRPGDFLFSRANTIELVGACVIAARVTRQVMLSDKILRLRVVGDLDSWLLHVLRSLWGRSEIERLATGNQESMRNIGQDRLRAVRVPLPPSAERMRILAEVSSRLASCTGLQDTLGANLKRATSLRQSILAAAFAGELLPPAHAPARLSMVRQALPGSRVHANGPPAMPAPRT